MHPHPSEACCEHCLAPDSPPRLFSLCLQLYGAEDPSGGVMAVGAQQAPMAWPQAGRVAQSPVIMVGIPRALAIGSPQPMQRGIWQTSSRVTVGEATNGVPARPCASETLPARPCQTPCDAATFTLLCPHDAHPCVNRARFAIHSMAA